LVNENKQTEADQGSYWTARETITSEVHRGFRFKRNWIEIAPRILLHRWNLIEYLFWPLPFSPPSSLLCPCVSEPRPARRSENSLHLALRLRGIREPPRPSDSKDHCSPISGASRCKGLLHLFPQ